MPAVNQNFSVYQGDDAAPVFTVRNSLGQPIDISTATEIEWISYLCSTEDPILKKKMTLGEIAFVTNGTDGQLQVSISKIDTAALAWGWEFHSCIITDSGSKVTTVATGRMAVLERGKA